MENAMQSEDHILRHRVLDLEFDRTLRESQWQGIIAARDKVYDDYFQQEHNEKCRLEWTIRDLEGKLQKLEERSCNVNMI